MPVETHENARTRFGEFEVDRPACALFRSGQRVPLQIQPFRVLEALLDSAGQVVTRESLYAKLWPGKVYIDVDRGLNNAVNRLRQALDDSGSTPVFIETLPRIGYRFIHPLETPAAAVAPQPEQPAGPAARTNRHRSLPLAMATLYALAVVALAIAVSWWTGSQDDTSPRSKGDSRPVHAPEAQDAYSRAERFLEQRNKESLKLAIEHLQRATELDPTFAEAFALLAAAYAGAGSTTNSQFLTADEALEPALAAAERALQLDPNLAKAHIALARVLNSLQPWSRPTDLAIEQSYRRGLELDPADAESHLQFGNFLAKRGRRGEALAQFRSALELDPLSPSANSRLGQELMGAGRTEEGLELLRRTVELDPFQFNARVRLGWGYLTVGDLDLAEGQFSAADEISPGSRSALSGLGFVAARKGDEKRARELLDGLLSVTESVEDPFHVAIVYVGLKEREESLKWLDRTVRASRVLHGSPPWGLQAPIYDWLRDDPRFGQLQRAIDETSVDDAQGAQRP
jgi:DNA-binding winged helix-turn-helix (wHTH) protein/Tfp pilus assembly protein PilF